MITPLCTLVGALLLSTPLTVEHVQASAKRHFPALIAADADISAAEGEQLAAAGGFDPSWTGRVTADALSYYPDVQVDTSIEQPTSLWGTSFNAGYRLGRGSFPDYAGGQITNDQGEFRGGLTIPLLRNGPIDRRRATLKRADLALQNSTAQKHWVMLDVLRAASARYYAWVSAGLRRAYAEQMLLLAKERDSQIVARVKSGDLSQFEQIDNARTIAQREAALVQADRAFQQSAIALSLYLRDDDGDPLIATLEKLPAQLAPPSPVRSKSEDLVTHALSTRPDLKGNTLTLTQNKIERDLQKNQMLPALDLRLIGSQDIGAGSATRRPFEFAVGLVLDVPLAMRLQRGRVQAAEANFAKSEALLRLQRDRIALEVRDAQNAELTAIERYTATVKEAQLAEEVAKLERARFALGDSTILFVNLRETASLEAQSRAVEAAADAHRASIDLLAVTALLGSDTTIAY